MYFYQKNFIYDISSYPKTKDTSNNIIDIADIDINDLNYYYNQFSRPKILLSTGIFSPWGAKDVLLADTWTIDYNPTENTYSLRLYISNTDITSYDVNNIKYLIFLDDITYLEINYDTPNFNNFLVKNNTLLKFKFRDTTSQYFHLPKNTVLTKTNDCIYISCSNETFLYTLNFNTNAQQEIILPYNFPHFINLKIQRPTNTTEKILKLQLIIVDKNTISNIVETYYFSIPAGQILNTFSLTPLYNSGANYELNNSSVFKLNLAWTSDGNTLTTENTNIDVQCGWYLPINNLTIYF